MKLKRWKTYKAIGNREKREGANWLLFFVFGFFLGVLLVHLKTNYFLEDDLFFGEELLNRLSYTSFHNEQYMVYLLQNRIGILLFLLVAATTIFGIVILYLYVAWFGMSLGILMSVVTIRYGGKGILIFFAALLPQEILYIPAFLILVNLLHDLCAVIYFPGKMFRSVGIGKKQFFARGAFTYMFLMGVVIMGVFFESYVNPYFLRKILHFL
ncbi:MAG: stage II sporulation protein M [Lachnospiraceae bacterium]|nr:stage II sporulation protein M [Lachnospiraceae bacterium]